MKKTPRRPSHQKRAAAVGRQARFLEQGRQMLEKKRDLLTRLVYERLAQYRELRAQTVRELAEAYHWLGIVQIAHGRTDAVSGVGRVETGGGDPGGGALQRRRRISSVTAEPLPLQPVGLMWTDVSFDEARLRLRELTVTLARLGEAENALWRLLAASRKTQSGSTR